MSPQSRRRRTPFCLWWASGFCAPGGGPAGETLFMGSAHRYKVTGRWWTDVENDVCYEVLCYRCMNWVNEKVNEKAWMQLSEQCRRRTLMLSDPRDDHNDRQRERWRDQSRDPVVSIYRILRHCGVMCMWISHIMNYVSHPLYVHSRSVVSATKQEWWDVRCALKKERLLQCIRQSETSKFCIDCERCRHAASGKSDPTSLFSQDALPHSLALDCSVLALCTV